MQADVVLLTYGEPSEPSLVEQWRYSNRILYKLTRLVAPIPKVAVPLLGLYRGYGRVSTWKEEKYHSPLESVTERQKEGIEDQLRIIAPEVHWRVHIAYEFRDPDLRKILTRIDALETDCLIFVPLYLAISDFTTGISQRDFAQYKQQNSSALPDPAIITFRPCLHEIAHIMAGHVREQLTQKGISAEERKNMGLLLGCHGTVVEAPKGISDTGYTDTFLTYRHLEKEFTQEFKAVDIGWLNHRLGGEWTSPTLEQSAKQMLEQGIARFVYFPFGFVADNAETQLEGRVVLRNLGIADYTHLPCLNGNSRFLHYVSELIVRTVKESQTASRAVEQAAV